MFERFTKPARSVVTDAERYADDTTASEIRPEHLLMALLDQEGCLGVRVMDRLGAPAATVREALDGFRQQYVDGLDEDDAEALKAIGIDLDEVVRRIDRNLGGLSKPRRHEGRQRFSRDARKVLELALREAISLHHNYIGTEHLLLGLARGGDRVVTDTFAACHLDRAAMRQAVVDAVRQVG
jgi:ATP-dependent Clp protease ATP-binding subunit ClpA